MRLEHNGGVSKSTIAIKANPKAHLDHQACYQALQRRDNRFDGRFYTGVKTTGIFCRPSCPARTPKSTNITFFQHAAAASEAGFRPCRRCRPELAPSSPEWNRRADLAGRALQLIDQGELDRHSVKQVAANLGVSERHLRRELQAEIGVGPNQLARTRRLTTARILLDQTSLSITDIAYASGFSSIRQFNDVFRAAFDSPPSELRSQPSQKTSDGPNEITIALKARGEFDWNPFFDFCKARAIPGLELAIESTDETLVEATNVASSSFRRGLPGGWIELRPGDGGISLRCCVDDLERIANLVSLARRVTDIDTDLEPITEHLAKDPALASKLGSSLAPRLPGAFDRFELAVRAIVGQQVSVAGARTTLGNLVSLIGDQDEPEARLGADNQSTLPPLLRQGFPTAEQMASTSLESLGMPARRKATLAALASEVAEGRLDLSPASDQSKTHQQLLELPGIGPWTAGYITMRAMNDPDGWPTGDLVLKKSLGLSARELEERSKQWQPWRSYAALLLWRTAGDLSVINE